MRPLRLLFAGPLLTGLGILVVGCGLFGSNDDTSPAAPENATASWGDAEITLTWDAIEGGDLDGYNVYRKTGSEIENLSGRDPQNGASLLAAPTYTDDAVEGGTTYFYVVTAVIDGNESDPSQNVELPSFPPPEERPKY